MVLFTRLVDLVSGNRCAQGNSAKLSPLSALKPADQSLLWAAVNRSTALLVYLIPSLPSTSSSGNFW